LRDVKEFIDADKSKYEKIIKNKNYLVIKTGILSKILSELGRKLDKNNIVVESREINELLLSQILRELGKIVFRCGDLLNFSEVDKQFKSFRMKMIEEYFRYFSEYRQGLRELIEIHISSLTGLVNIADYLVASLERKPCMESRKKQRGFVYQILSSREIEKLSGKLVVCKTL